MISNTELQRNDMLAKLKPALLAVSEDHNAALCPACAVQIDEDHPPYEAKAAAAPMPQCPHCFQILDIQFRDIDMSTMFGNMNDAQHQYAVAQFQKLGASLIRLVSGNYHLLFAGTRCTLHEDTFVLSTYNDLLSRLEEMQMKLRYRGGAYHG